MHNQPQSMLMISSVLSLSRIYDPDNSSGVRACPGQAIRRTTLSSGAQPFIVLLSRNGDADQKKSTCSKPLVPQAWRINPLACSRNSPQAVRSENTWPGREEGRERMSTTVWSLSPWLRWHTGPHLVEGETPAPKSTQQDDWNQPGLAHLFIFSGSGCRWV